MASPIPNHPAATSATSSPILSNPSSTTSSVPATFSSPRPFPHATSSQPPLLGKPMTPPVPPPLLPNPPIGFAHQRSVAATPAGARPHGGDITVFPRSNLSTAVAMAYASSGQQRPPLLPTPVRAPGPHPQPGLSSLHAMRPPSQTQPQPQFLVPRQVRPPAAVPTKNGPASTGASKTISNTVTPSSQDYASKERELVRDDAVVMVYDRKVRLADDGGSGSLYALCRSWVRNGLPQEPQTFFGNRPKILPSPLPASDSSVADFDGDSGAESSENEKQAVSDEVLSPRELLQGHIRRAKRVRSQLKKERLQRIKRYNQRLTLLLPLY